jgi:hypothetical protein
MTDYLPVVEDISEEIAQIAIQGPEFDLEPVAERLNVAKSRLQHLISTDPEAIDLIRATRAEYQVLLQMRAELLAADALETLEKAMHEQLGEKVATAAVRAADSLLDRTLLPKIARVYNQERQAQETRALPDLTELVEQAKTDGEAHQLVDQYMDVLKKIDAIRRGAKEIIDGSSD